MVLLPGCPCCGSGSGCQCPEGEELPDKVTVTLNGLTKSNVQLNLLSLSFSSCFGTGAAGTVKAPGGLPYEKGPIESVTLTQGGAGYAKLGRVEPTLTAVVANGAGATFTPTLTNKKVTCGFDYWEIGSLSVSGGTGYVDGDQVTFEVAQGDTEEQPAYATIHTGRAEPTLAASAWGGTGAMFNISYSKNVGDPSTWTISSISVTNGGAGYHGGSSLNITLGTGDVADDQAYGIITTDRTAPTLSVSVSSETGSGAILSPSISPTWDEYGPAWGVSSINITDGGAGYSEYDELVITPVVGQQSPWGWFYGYVSSVDENGAITGISIYYGGAYYKDEGVITGVTLWSGGAYHKDNGIPASVTVDSRGRYYREDASVPPYVAAVTVSVAQSPPSAGSGAEISVEIDDNTSSDTFGVIRSLHLDNAGTGYLEWTWADCDVKRLNGRSITVPIVKERVNNLLSVSFSSCFGSGAAANVVAPGGDPGVANGPITSVSLTSPGSGYAKIGREEPVLNFGVNSFFSSGTGATFTPTFSRHTDSCGVDFWKIESVAVSGGTCYGVRGRTAPPFFAVATTGSGAMFSLTIAEAADSCFNARYWYVSDVTIVLGADGTPYENNSPLTIAPQAGVVVKTAFAATLHTDERGVPTSVTITNGGKYFLRGEAFLDNALNASPATADDKVQESAELVIHADDDGVPTSVTVSKKGIYYRENKSLPPYVADVTVTLSQRSPSNGSGAEITATVNSDPYSSNFGKLSSVNLVQAGDRYLSWANVKTCFYERCIGNTGTIRVAWRGYDTPPKVYVDTDCHITFTADEGDAPFSCQNMSFTATEPVGGTAVVTAGGGGLPTCAEIYAAESISVTLTGEDATLLYARQEGAPPCCEHGCSFAMKTTGSDYNGTFVCQYKSMSGALRYYEYELGELCGHKRTIGVFVPPTTGIIGVTLSNVVCYISHNHDGTSTPSFDCGPSGRTCYYVEQRHAVGNLGGGTTCGCDLESMSGGGGAFFGAISDEKGIEGFLYGAEFVSVTGDANIRVIKAEIGG